MVDEPQQPVSETQRPIERIIEFIDEMDDRLEAALAQYGEFIPAELRPIITVIDEGLDKITDFLRPFAEQRPIMTWIERIRARIAARRAKGG